MPNSSSVQLYGDPVVQEDFFYVYSTNGMNQTHAWGPFSHRMTAEQAVLALIGRHDIQTACIDRWIGDSRTKPEPFQT